MKRPTRNEEYVIKAAAEELASDLMEWGNAKESEQFDYRDLAAQLVKSAGFMNGYELAREAERKGWEPDARFVEIVDAAGHLRYSAHNKAVKEWVKGWKITVPFQLGQMVTIKHEDRRVVGKIITIYAETATCTVCCAELGHVESGEGTHGLIINSEDIQPAQEAVSVR